MLRLRIRLVYLPSIAAAGIAALMAVAAIGCSDERGDGPSQAPGAVDDPASLAGVALGDPLTAEQRDRLAQQGRGVFTQNNCQTCHTVEPDGPELLGPTLAGLAGDEVELTAGGTTVADAEYLYESIVRPQRRLVAGYSSIMPAYDRLSERERLALVAYIRSLPATEPAAPGQGDTPPGPDLGDPAARDPGSTAAPTGP